MAKNTSFMGFETWFNNLRMLLKMQLYIFMALVLLQIMSLVILGFIIFNENETNTIISYLKTYLSFNSDELITVMIDNQKYTQTLEQFRATLKPQIDIFSAYYSDKAIYTFFVYLLWFPINYLFSKRASKQVDSKYQRGATKITADELNKLTKKERSYLPFGDVKMPVSAEVKHTLIIGRPGVGKTVCMSAILQKIIERGDRAIIHDFKGDYLQKFYRPGVDIIFNPFDERSHYWNFFDEIESPMDVDAVGYALIPDAKGAGMDPFWNNAARDVFTGIVNHLILNEKKDYNSLYSFVTASSEIIADVLKATPGSEAGATTIADPEAKQTGSILSVMTQYTKIFSFLREPKNNDDKKRFTIKDWLNGDIKGNIYITNYSTMQDTLAPILTLLIDLMGRKLLSEKDDSSRRVFFMLDEFGALQKMQTITRLLTLARSKGGGVFIGIQDLGQIDKIYGKEHKQTIVNACGSTAVFAVADADTSEALSKGYGEYLATESYVTQSMGVDNNRDGLSINQQKSKERIILPSEITSLPDLTCYVRFAGYPVAKSVLSYKHYADKNEPMQMRTDFSYSTLLAMSQLEMPEDLSYEIVPAENIVETPKKDISKQLDNDREIELQTNLTRMQQIENDYDGE